MNRLTCALSLAFLVGCHGFSIDVSAPYPPEEPPNVEEPPPPPPGPYSHLQQRTSFSPKDDVELREACYVGDFVLGRSQVEVAGVGIDKTVIDGNLVVQTQCEISHLTVTGDVIFEGNQAKLEEVDFHGQIIDKGLQNRY